MIKLRFSKAQYNGYCDGKVTTCTYKCTLYDSESKIIIERFNARGKATCAPDDTPDEWLGRALSEARAKMHAYKHARKYFDGFASEKSIDEQLRRLWDMKKSINRLRFCYFDEMEHIKKLTNQ